MFKKLKEKITEEVKSSPQRFQQLTQSVSDRLQNASTSDENFFSIGEDDASTSNSNTEPGFTNVSLMSPQESRFRRNSNSSVASDVSFLPRYESSASMYHLQSDLDVSASELEDNASTSSQLGHLTKEQIYSAFQKAQMRYHKYRGRYTDLARHYKDLERENVKMKSVLVETQDKAIRRVTELKEQCTLEQKAKAHLEGALRDDIDEKQFKIQSLETKIQLLRNGNPSSQETENLETLNKYLTDARQEIENLNEKIQELKANAIIFQTKEQEYKLKIAGLEKEILLFSEREKENNLSLAQNKMELHNELLSKDNEISNLKQDNDTLRKNLEALTSGNGKLENLQIQNKKLIDKLESLSQKCVGYESDLLKMEQYKIELQNSNKLNSELKNEIKELEVKLERVREDAKKNVLSLESKIREKVQKEFEEKHDELKNEFKRKLNDISTNTASLNELQLRLLEKEEEVNELRKVNAQILEDLSTKTTKYDYLEKKYLDLIEDTSKLRGTIGRLEKELTVTRNESLACKLRKTRLKENTVVLESQLENYKQLESVISVLKKEKNDLLERLQSSRDQEEKEQMKKIELLESSLKSIDEENKNILETLEEERKKYEDTFQINDKLNQELEDLRTYVLEQEESLEEKKNILQSKLADEREKLMQKLDASENAVKHLEETSLSLGEELKELKTKKDEVVMLETRLKAFELETNKLRGELSFEKEKYKQLRVEYSNLNKCCENLEIIRNEKESLEQQLRKSEKRVREIEEANAVLCTKVQNHDQQVKIMNKSLEERLTKLQEKEAKTSELKLSLNDLRTELEIANNLLKIKNEELDSLKTESSKCSEMLQQKADLLEAMQKIQEERNQILDEVDLLKNLLEDANNSVAIKEHELSKIEENIADFKQRNEKLLEDLENRLQIEKELSEKLSRQENDLKFKDQQIDGFVKKLEEYNGLIEEKSEGFLKIFNNFLEEPINNLRFHRGDKNLQNFEEKLKNFEQIFSMEKENLAKILVYLKQCEGKYQATVLEKSELEKEKDELLAKLDELKRQMTDQSSAQLSIKKIEEELVRIKEENASLVEEDKKMKQIILELESRNTQIVSDSNFISEENNRLITEIEELKIKNEEIQTKYSSAEMTINNLKTDVTRLEVDLAEATNQNNFSEMERHINELQHEKQLLQEEIEELKTAPININHTSNSGEIPNKEENYVKEIENLRTKVVQYKSLDLTNRSSIEFYENELQKLKNQNEKLNRKLDETLVTLGHCSELSHSTEIEYLKNVLYNYMLGKESLVLARVIAAVCKFDPHQTETILAKEQQKQTLLGQLGLL